MHAQPNFVHLTAMHTGVREVFEAKCSECKRPLYEGKKKLSMEGGNKVDEVVVMPQLMSCSLSDCFA